MSGYATATFTAILPKRRKLIDGDKVAKQCERRMWRLIDDLHDRAIFYPAKRAESTYVRTFKLANSWGARGTVKMEGDDLVGEVTSKGSVARYNKYVKGKKDVQAMRMRSYGWESIEDIMEEEWPKAERDFKDIVASAGR